MSQAAHSFDERRREPRRPAAFAFWFNPLAARGRFSGWMLNVSTGGASFLTSAKSAPVVGERLRLAEMFSKDRLVREGNPTLPRFARVVRVGKADGVTRRVAVRFEADSAAPLSAPRTGRFVAACPEQQLAPAPAPPPGLALAEGLPMRPVPVEPAS